MDQMPLPISPEQEAANRQNTADILMFYAQARQSCARWHDDIARYRRLYNLNHYTLPPKPGETLYNDPTYTNVVDLATGILLGNRMSWSAYGWDVGPDKTTPASVIEKYLAGLLDINSEREEMLIPYEVLLNFVRDGCAVIYSVWDAQIARLSRMESEADPESPTGIRERRVFQEPPLRIKVIDPLTIFPMLGGPHRWARVFQVQERTVRDIELEYGIRLKDYAHLDPVQKGLERTELIDYWCWMRTAGDPADPTAAPMAVFNAVLCRNEIVIPLRPMPGYNDLPYTIGFFKPVDRLQPEGWGHSILRPLEDTVAVLEQNVNRRQRQINVYSSLPPVARLRANRALQVDPSIGNVIQLNEGEDFGFPTWPGNAPDVERAMDFLRARTQQSGFSDIMFGSGATQTSGYALSMLGDQNRIRLTQPIEHLQLFWMNWAHKALALTLNFSRNSAVLVYGQQQGATFTQRVVGSALEGYRVRCEIKPVYPNERSRQHAMATQVRGLLSDETIMDKYLDVGQPDEEKKRVLAERAQTHPLMVQYMLLSTLKELASSGDEAAKAALLQIESGGNGGQPGRPDEPRRMEPFAGMPSSTGQPTRQERGMPAPGQGAVDQMEGLANAAPGMLEGGF